MQKRTHLETEKQEKEKRLQADSCELPTCCSFWCCGTSAGEAVSHLLPLVKFLIFCCVFLAFLLVLRETLSTKEMVSNVTNSTDPQCMTSPVFIGNLSTLWAGSLVWRQSLQSTAKLWVALPWSSMLMRKINFWAAIATGDDRVIAGQSLDVN